MDKKKITIDDLISYAFTDISNIPVPLEKNVSESPEWRKLRKSYKEQHPLCEVCLNKGKKSPSLDVHHIIPMSKGGDLLSIDNLIALCHQCHSEVHDESFGGVTVSLDMSGTISISAPPKVFETKIVGTKEKNADGSDRQEIISKCKKGEEVKLVRVLVKYENNYLIEVFTKSGERIGCIDESVARRSYLAYDMEHGCEVTAKISEILGEPFNLECIIEITRTEINWREANQYLEKDKMAKHIIFNAKSLERKTPDKAISLYREAMEILIEIDQGCKNHLSPWRYERYPIDRITILLEKQNKYKECLEEIEKYQSMDDRIGIGRYNMEEMEKRKIRVKEKLQKTQIGSVSEPGLNTKHEEIEKSPRVVGYTKSNSNCLKKKSEYLKKLKESQRNVTIKKQVDTYFELLNKIIKARRERNMEKVFEFSQMSLGLLGALIKDTKKDSNYFDIVEIPALDEGFIIAVVKGLKEQIENFKEVVSYYKELEPWKNKFEEIEKLSEVVDYIKSNSGCLQKDLKKIFDMDPNLLGNCAFYLAACGLIKKEKVGNTFRLVWQ
jgi:5-methylcytosine-specific restriction protein A